MRSCASLRSGHSSEGQPADDWDSDDEPLRAEQLRAAQASDAAAAAGSEAASTPRGGESAEGAPSASLESPQPRPESSPLVLGSGADERAAGCGAVCASSAQAQAPQLQQQPSAAGGGVRACRSTSSLHGSVHGGVSSEREGCALLPEKRLRDELLRALSRAEALASACARLEEEVVQQRRGPQHAGSAQPPSAGQQPAAAGDGGGRAAGSAATAGAAADASSSAPAAIAARAASEKAAAALAAEACTALAAAAASAAAAAQARSELDKVRGELAAGRRRAEQAAGAHALELQQARAEASQLRAQLQAAHSQSAVRARAAGGDGGAGGEEGRGVGRLELVCAIVSLRAQLLEARAQLDGRKAHGDGGGPGGVLAPAEGSARAASPELGTVEQIATAAAAAMLGSSARLDECLVAQLVGALDEMNELERLVNEAKADKRAALERADAAETRSTLLEAQLSAFLTVHAAHLGSSATCAPRGRSAGGAEAGGAAGGRSAEVESAYAQAFLPLIAKLEGQLAAITAERDRLRTQLQQSAGLAPMPRRGSAGDVSPRAVLRASSDIS